MEKNKKVTATTCEKCVIQSRIIQKYSEEIVDLQRQVSVLSSRLLKYEPDPPAQTLCQIKIEDKSDDEFVTDHNAMQSGDECDDEKDFKKDVADCFSEESRDIDNDDNPDNDYEPTPDENYDSSEVDVKDVVSTKARQGTSRKMRKCKTCNEEFSSSRGLLRHNHEIHGKRIAGTCLVTGKYLLAFLLQVNPSNSNATVVPDSSSTAIR